MKALALPLLAVLTFGALAQEPGAAVPVPPPPAGAGGFLQAPEPAQTPVTGEAVEPDITIREEGQQIITEYRVNGLLYMIRIQPQFGPPYFLVDTNGDGLIDVRDSSPLNNNIPQWLLFSWQ